MWNDPATWLHASAWVVLSAGVLMLLLAFRGRVKRRSWCRHCDYDLTGLADTPDAVCPECGSRSPRSGPPTKRRRWALTIAALPTFLPLATERLWLEPLADYIWTKVLPSEVLTKRFTYAGLDWQLRVDRGSRRSFGSNWDRDGWRTWIEHPIVGWVQLNRQPLTIYFNHTIRDDVDLSDVGELLDVTGDGVPEVFMKASSRGAHCCYTLYIIDTRSKDHPVIAIDGDDSTVEPQDLDRDGVYELIARDWSFAYSGTTLGARCSARVVLSIVDGVPTPSAALMRTSVPSDDSIRDAAASRLDGTEEVSPNDLVEPMITWFYQGHEDAAWQFLDLVWPDDKRGKPEFRAGLLRLLEESPYWPSLRVQYAAMAASIAD